MFWLRNKKISFSLCTLNLSPVTKNVCMGIRFEQMADLPPDFLVIYIHVFVRQ